MNIEVFPGGLSAALQNSSVPPGSILYLHAGAYLEGDLNCALSNVLIRPVPGEKVVLAPSSGYRIIYFSSVHDVVMEGLILDGTLVSGEAVKIDGVSAYIKLLDCEIMRSPHQGVLLTGTVNHCEISRCNIHHNGVGHLDHGVYIGSQHPGLVVTMTKNKISDNASNGVHAFSGSPLSKYLVSGNLLERNGEVGIGCYHGQAIVYNNIVRNTGQRGITLRYDLIKALIAFNTVADSAQQNIELASFYQSPDLFLYNNLCLGAGEGIFNRNGIVLTQSNNLFSGWENVQDGGGDDIRPAAGNSIAHAGISLLEIEEDYGGFKRGSPPTVGAWEDTGGTGNVSEWSLNGKVVLASPLAFF